MKKFRFKNKEKISHQKKNNNNQKHNFIPFSGQKEKTENNANQERAGKNYKEKRFMNILTHIIIKQLWNNHTSKT
ncbi:hypothetical protein M0P48_01555 [Candidatus Gracilibacteria bacterium]|jgi:hypothetical protein|nr:hypothetical protein [Candidatus Gracilibacteria bacterium]